MPYRLTTMKVVNAENRWWAFVHLPEEHVCIGASKEFFTQLPAGVPAPPIAITQERGGAPATLFGFIHNGTEEEAKNAAQKLADYFKLLADEHADTVRAAPKHFCDCCERFFTHAMEWVAGCECCETCAPRMDEYERGWGGWSPDLARQR